MVMMGRETKVVEEDCEGGEEKKRGRRKKKEIAMRRDYSQTFTHPLQRGVGLLKKTKDDATTKFLTGIALVHLKDLLKGSSIEVVTVDQTVTGSCLFLL